MKMKLLLLCALAVADTAHGELLDPRTRDEDISGTEVTVTVTQDATGLYRYVYTLTSPPSNIGTIGSLFIDVSCPGPVEARMDLSQLPYTSRSISETGHHVPVAIGGSGFTMGVTTGDEALWAHQIKPGGSGNDIIISPYGPGSRRYILEPKMGPEGYDYESFQWDPSIPWIPDFTITGFTTGPACPGAEEPMEPKESVQHPRFPGSMYPNESEFVNGLLSYSLPTRDRFHVSDETRELEITIHYSDEIDPKSFRVMPQKHNLRRMFNPKPGTTETVSIPLEAGKNKIQLQVKPMFLPPRDMKDDEYGGRGPDMDQDDFEIRVRESGDGKQKKK